MEKSHYVKQTFLFCIIGSCNDTHLRSAVSRALLEKCKCMLARY